jgi:hypothetical protein
LIIVRLEAGLGNQMFQYALGRHLSITTQQELVLDTSVLIRQHSTRRYGLDCFNVHGAAIADLSYIKPLDALWVVREFRSGFNPTVLQVKPPNLLLHGFWQTDKYFSASAQVIRNDFTFKSQPSQHHCNLQAAIAACTSVCLHVRRTDYLEPHCNLCILDLEFYKSACDYIAAQVPEPHFFIFSDDLVWCDEHLDIPYPHTFAVPDSYSPNHLRLMSQCKHFIIANSSFSWWAAWLGSEPGKIVIAPRYWFRREGEWDPRTSMFLISSDITPMAWVRL